MQRGKARGFRSGDGKLFPDFEAHEPALSVVLPKRSKSFVELVDRASSTRVTVSHAKSRDVEAQTYDGYAIYPGAHESGATVLYAPRVDGFEDYVSFESKPSQSNVAYELGLSREVGGLRLVENTLEILDVHGAPRLRAAPPFLVGADGHFTGATVSVEGCAVDKSPAPPWKRPPTAPGADHCLIRVSWRNDALKYPALLDPSWSSTANTMTSARREHTATLLTNGKVLVAGGRNGTGTAGLATAELYDPVSKTWATTGSMTTARRLHAAVQLPTSSNATTSGKVFVSGGIDGTTSLTTARLYDPVAGTWAAAANLSAARHQHTATLLASGQVLVAGGMNGTTVLNTASRYNASSGTGTWTAVGNLSAARRAHTATLLVVPGNATLNNKVLIVGGNSGGTTSVTTVQLFDGTSSFSTLTALSSAREGHTATALSNGNVLVTGGKNGSTTLATTLQFNAASGSGSWGSAGNLTAARQAHSASLFPTSIVSNGRVLVAGGSNGTSALSSTELWNGTSTWTAATAMPATVQGHTATVLATNMVLVAGGVSGSTVQNQGRLYDPSLGLTCTSNSQCTTGFCTNGVCCNTACSEQECSACNLAGTVGTCSPRTNGTTCNDSNACTGSSSCQAGVCTGANPVVCTAQDQCHVAGTCNPATGACSNPNAANGMTCNDANACTGSSSCQAGTCTGANPVVCTAQDQCHVAGTCNTTTGACSNPNATNGTTCDDSNACTGSSACQTGACTGANPVVCTAQDPCHDVGTCNTSSGVCSNPTKTNGSACNDATVCNGSETCQTGTCTAGTPPTVGDGNPCTADACDAVAGVTHTPVATGTLCLDANLCNGEETCNSSGTCVAGTPPATNDGNPCTTDACDPMTGVSHTPVAAGTSCGPANACSGPDTCDGAGTCQAGAPTERPASTALADVAAFLYSGSSPVQTGVAAGAIKPDAVAVIRGQVSDPDGSPIPLQVSIAVVDHPEFGSTLSRTDDGGFDMAVNGGQTLRIRFELPGYLTVERTVIAPRQDYVVLSEVVLTPPDALATTVDLSGASPDIQVARGTPSVDAAGGRQATLLVPPGTVAVMTLPNGSAESLPSMHVRATEYSVGTLGQNALPATPPSGTPYPYAVELGADEAVEAGASLVEFSQTLSFYLENYVGLPVGTSVPHGFYDSALGSWVSSSPGRVLKIISVNSGMAELDVDGDGAADTGGALATLGITDLERSELATLYEEGQSVWRIPLAHFSTHGSGNPVGPSDDSSCPVAVCRERFPDGSANPNGAVIPCVIAVISGACPPPDPSCSVCTGCNDLNFCQNAVGGPTTIGCFGESCVPDHYLCCPPPSYGLWGSGFGQHWCEAWASGPTTCNYPPPPSNPDGDGPGECKQPHASTISCQSQALGEEVPVAGTPYVLHYQSDRQRGRLPELNLPVTSSPVPAGLLGIEMTVSVAGRTFPYAFAPQPNLTIPFQWDGLDAYGGSFQGSQPVTVETSYLFAGFYQNASAFGLDSTGDRIQGVSTLKPFKSAKSWKGQLGTWDERLAGLGGWSLNVQHVYDVSSRMLRRGDGSNQTLAGVPPVIETVAGTGSAGSASGDGGPATSAVLPSPSAVAVRGDGSLLISDGASCIRQVDAQGVIATVAGQCGVPGFAGDGGPAVAALLQAPSDIALGADGSVYIAEPLNHRIRRVAPTGVITTVAGSGPTGAQAGQFSGDDGPATDARFSSPSGVDVSRSGVLYIADTGNHRVRSVGADGIVRTVVGSGLTSPQRVRVAADGNLYLTESGSHRVQRVGRDGKIYPFAGTGAPGYLGDGGKAQSALLTAPSGIAVQADDSVVILDQNNTIRLVSPGGIISTLGGVAGVATHAGDRGFAAAASFGPAKGIGVGADGSIYLAATSDNRVRRIAPGLPGFSGGEQVIKIPSPDGEIVHTFDAHGRHLSDTHGLTGAVLTSFAYDCVGRLTSVTDADGKVTLIQRNSAGDPTAIVGPFGQTTALTLDPNGYLATVTEPSQATTTFTYSAAGLMASKLDPNGGFAEYTYDEAGRLTRDDDAAGGAKILTRSSSPNGFTINMSTAEGAQSTFETRVEPDGTLVRSNTLVGASKSSLRFSAKGVTTTVSPDGTKTVSTPAPDPRFGVLAPALSVATTLPQQRLTRTETSSRSVTYSGTNLATITETSTVNGNSWLRHFDAPTRTWTTTSPLGRQSSTLIDAAGRPTTVAVSGVTPRSTSFDPFGRPSVMVQGTRQTTFNYFNAGAANGYLQSVTDATNTATTFIRDALGRPLTETRAGTTTSFGWDPVSNLSSVTPPGKPTHGMLYTPVNLLESYEPPPAGLPVSATSYDYDLDRMLRTETRPDGVSIVRTPDSARRLDTVAIPGGLIDYDYVFSNATSGAGKVSNIRGPYGVDLAFTYDGSLALSTTWSGDVTGSVRWQHNNDFQKILETVSGPTGSVSTAFGYDSDLLLTCASPTTCSPPGADALRLTRHPQHGMVTGITLGQTSETWSYNAYGELARQTATFGGSPLVDIVYDEAGFERDALGRITRKTETILGVTKVYEYRYDALRRLDQVKVDGVVDEEFTYDANGNRLTAYKAGVGTVTATYDDQDRLLTYGTYVFTYTANGELETKTNTANGDEWLFEYDALGNLVSVGLPNGDFVEYLVDGMGRRVGKKKNGVLLKQWIYRDELKPAAELNGSGNLVSEFVYGEKANVPEYVVREGATYRVVSDHLGSARRVVNVVSSADVPFGASYSSFGEVTGTGLEWMPFGFAGGIYDTDTRLVRFGARDLEPLVGRWTSKDPIRFDSGDSPNMYLYSNGDGTNRRDSTGLATEKDCPRSTTCGTSNCMLSEFNDRPCPTCPDIVVDGYCLYICSSSRGTTNGTAIILLYSWGGQSDPICDIDEGLACKP